MADLILPKTYREVKTPLIFLAGPIRSAPNWQDEAIEFLFSQESNLTIVSPRRGVRDKIANYVVSGDENYFPRQRIWERHYLDIASQTGAIMFWLPGEEMHDCKKVYGAMTRFEAGLTLGWYRYNKDIKFCVGSDGKFQELDIMLADFKIDAPEKTIFKSLQETCLEAVRLSKR